MRSPSYERAYGAASADSPDRQYAEERATGAFLELHETIPTFAIHLIGPLEDLCVEDRHISLAVLPAVRDLLEYLVVELRLTGPRKPHAGSLRAGNAVAMLEAAPRPASNIDRQSMLKVMRALRPDLDELQLDKAYDLGQALKQREIFRRSKRETRSNVIQLPLLKN